MAEPYSLDLRVRVIAFIEAGSSRRAAARHFGVSESFAIKLYDQWIRTGSAVAKPKGGSVGKLTFHRDFLLCRIEERPDMTMPELAKVLEREIGVRADPASLSRFLCRHGYTYKKRRFWQRNKNAPMSVRNAMNGSVCDSPS